MVAQSKMLETFMQTSQRQQQQLMEATQSQQATTNQLLQTLSSLMASMVPGANSPATAGSHPPSQSSATSSDTAMQNTAPLSSTHCQTNDQPHQTHLLIATKTRLPKPRTPTCSTPKIIRIKT
jgi:hypothetical protein